MKWILVLLLSPVVAHADAVSMSKMLKGEPASLLDVGMIRLELLTRDFGRRVGVYWTTASGTREPFRASINTSYDGENDRIYVSFFAMDSTATDAQMREGCEDAMEQVSIWIWKGLPSLFLHEGFDNTVEAAEPYRAIADLFELTCYISAADDSSVGRFWARRTLRDPELKIGPWS